MHIALIGATGNIGQHILSEALSRGHRVTAIVRHPEKLTPHNNLKAVAGSVYDTAALAAQLKGADAVISAFNPGWTDSELHQHQIEGNDSIIAATKQAGVKRLLVVGGAGSLQVPGGGIDVVDTPDFPEAWKGAATALRITLQHLRSEQELDWTLLSPAAEIGPGERTGRFRLGKDELLVDAKGESRISQADYAVAMIDELESPQHSRQRFTLAY
ncbi:MAG: NAD(P)-dependent oxidoreductase [Pedobacter sp.]|nr:NAD(P)-dependent oxidoreductase [Pedobacter sp.]